MTCYKKSDFVWVDLQLARTDVARSSCFEWGELLCLASFEVRVSRAFHALNNALLMKQRLVMLPRGERCSVREVCDSRPPAVSLFVSAAIFQHFSDNSYPVFSNVANFIAIVLLPYLSAYTQHDYVSNVPVIIHNYKLNIVYVTI